MIISRSDQVLDLAKIFSFLIKKHIDFCCGKEVEECKKVKKQYSPNEIPKTTFK